MKKLIIYIAVLSMFFGMFSNVNAEIDAEHMYPLTKASEYRENIWREYYVSEYGNDENNGSQNSPFKTIEKAKETVREVSDSMKGDIIVNIAEGYYFLNDRLEFSVEDSGKNGYNVYYKGAGGNKTVISGGEDISGRFSPVGDGSGMWVANVESREKIRELYINEKKAYMANNGRTVYMNDYYDDKSTSLKYDGFYISKANMGIFANPQDVELIWTTNWMSTVVPVENIVQDPKNSNQLIVKFKDSFFDVLIENDTYGPSSARPFQIRNAKELLDEPGEFYFDRTEQKLYYMPREGEDMNSATVIAPKLEQMMRFAGDTIDNRVKNITFEDVKIAHCTWLAPGKMGFKTGQQQSVKIVNETRARVEAGVLLDKTDNINFYGCYFFGLGGIAVDCYNAVSNTEIKGNAFSDIGDVAFVSGSEMSGDTQLEERGRGAGNGKSEEPPENLPSQLNINNGYARVSASFYGRTTDQRLNGIYGGYTHGDKYWTHGEYLWLSDNDYDLSCTWTGDPDAPSRGEKSWVMYDFDDAYSISRVVLGFDSSVLTKEERSNFEILLSNDKYFEEGNYVVAATQTRPASGLVTYKLNTEEKYRYLMIRTTGATKFGLSGAWIFTPDKKPFTKYQRNTDINFDNNYVTRCGDTTKSGGLSYYYNERVSITHNEISKVPWSGISAGWGWEAWPYGNKDNKITNNYIHEVTRELMDGGGIYTLGHQPGTVIAYNYLDDVELGNGALYPDHGTRNIYWTDNVVDNSYKVWHLWIQKIWNNSILNAYATNSYVTHNGDVSNIYNGVKTFPTGNPFPKAYAIMENAGLEDEYKYLADWVPEGETLYIPEENERYFDFVASGQTPRGKTMLAEAAELILNTDNFGNLPGQYAPEYKEKLSKAREAMINAGNDTISRMIELKELINEAGKSVKHYKLDEMIALCEEKLNSADSTGKDALQTAVTNAKTVLESQPDIETSYAEVVKLEEAYKNFAYANSNADVLYVDLDGAEKIEINNDTKTVTAIYPPSASLENRSISVVPFGTSENAAIYGKVNLNEGLSMPVFSSAKNEYSVWTLNAKNADTENTGNAMKTWTSENPEKLVNTANSSIYLAPQSRSAMNTALVKEGQSLEMSFKPLKMYDPNNITLIFGAASHDKVASDTNSEYADRYELILSKTSAALYSVKNGAYTLLGRKDSGVSSDIENKFKITMSEENGGANISVDINGKNVFNVRNNEKRTAGYFGFFNCETGIEVTDVSVK